MTETTERIVNLGLLGCGTVGGSLVELVQGRADDIAARTGVRLRVARIAVRSLDVDRGLDVDPSVFTVDAASLVVDPGVDVVVEVMGGIDPARDLIAAALRAGKPVVSANKELLAAAGAELFELADTSGVDLLFEAAVAGGIPFIRPLRESLVGEDVIRVMGIINGTTNYILTKMTEEGWSYADALAEAQALGYAEADPTADVEGFDAGAKAAIIATIAFGVGVTAADVHHEGISTVTADDIEAAGRLGYQIKLLAVAERFDDASVAVRVHPTMVPVTHPLASVRDSFNAVFVEGAAVGDLMFYGRGAGGFPTASAVLGDVVDAAVNVVKGTHASLGSFGQAVLRPQDDLDSAFYLIVEVVDRPGVLANVAGVFGANGVSIRSMEQSALADDGAARLMFITHTARESDVQHTLEALRALDVVRSVDSVIRVIGPS
ncbi:MAG: homoserine dehydrogenase [Microthrixaceae bacterium]